MQIACCVEHARCLCERCIEPKLRPQLTHRHKSVKVISSVTVLLQQKRDDIILKACWAWGASRTAQFLRDAANQGVWLEHYNCPANLSWKPRPKHVHAQRTPATHTITDVLAHLQQGDLDLNAKLDSSGTDRAGGTRTEQPLRTGPAEAEVPAGDAAPAASSGTQKFPITVEKYQGLGPLVNAYSKPVGNDVGSWNRMWD